MYYVLVDAIPRKQKSIDLSWNGFQALLNRVSITGIKLLIENDWFSNEFY